jgi:2'-5' RNA ligase
MRELSAAIRAQRHVRLGRMPVAEVVLLRSHLSPRGARYEALSRYPLGQPGDN